MQMCLGLQVCQANSITREELKGGGGGGSILVVRPSATVDAEDAVVVQLFFEDGSHDKPCIFPAAGLSLDIQLGVHAHGHPLRCK